ncbi:MAG TPA: cupin domain-containing protein [Burkholderiales bacterium]|nr:cupin domain-containing protein [Burkholderiales bacterium]
MIGRVRRVLTGHDSAGKSTILADGQAPNVKEMASMPGLALTDLWETTAAPASNAGHADAAARPVRLEPPKNGTLLRVVEFPPDAHWRSSVNSRDAFKSIGAAHVVDKSSADAMMHRTSTVDYAIVLSGEIHAVMEKGETLLRAGDILVQRGTNHSWSVRGNEPAMVAFVLVSAKPLSFGSRKKSSPAKKKLARKKKK